MRSAGCRLLLFLTLAASPAAAQDRATLSSAREAAQQGLAAYDAGNYQEAVDKLSRAYQVVRVPTLALFTARALVKVGRLVEAAEVYLEATRLTPPDADRQKHEKAQDDADREREELAPRIPRLMIATAGAPETETTVEVDGVDVPSALWATGRLVDPGARKVVGRSGSLFVEQSVTLAEGETRTVTLTFAAAATAAPAPAPVAAPPPAPPVQALPVAPAPYPTPAPPQVDQAAPGQGQRTAGWVLLGLGGIGFGFGTVTGILTFTKKSSLDADGCNENHCYVQQTDAVDSYNSMRTFSTIGFVAGAVGVAVGATLLLTAPGGGSGSGASVAAWVSPTSAGVAGNF